MKLTSTHYFIILVVLIIGGIVGVRYWSAAQPGQYDQFAQCLSESGAVFYGAFWCPRCAEQKVLFGNSTKYLNYVECSTPDGQNQTQECIDAGIKSYPTWEFTDGERLSGVVPLQQLGDRTGCEISG